MISSDPIELFLAASFSAQGEDVFPAIEAPVSCDAQTAAQGEAASTEPDPLTIG